MLIWKRYSGQIVSGSSFFISLFLPKRIDTNTMTGDLFLCLANALQTTLKSKIQKAKFSSTYC